MHDPLSADELMAHVRRLSDEIGPRPAGHPQEEAARQVIRQALQAAGLPEPEEQPLRAWDSWGYNLATPPLLALAANLFGGLLGRSGHLLGGALTLFSLSELLKGTRTAPQWLERFYPKRPTANLIVRLPPQGEVRRRVVLVGHTDTNKARPTFAPQRKRWLRATTSAGIGLLALNGAAQIGRALGSKKIAPLAHWLSLGALVAMLPILIQDERGSYIDGANDNASAVACLLGLGEALHAQPLQHTEVWLAFTAAEEIGCLGMRHLLQTYGDQLKTAQFIDFEMVGCQKIAYVTRHQSLSFESYTPDAQSLALAKAVSRKHPHLKVRGRSIVITEEVSILRQGGYRAICLVGVGPDGWLENWHQATDDSAHLHPAGLERAARFAQAMLHEVDRST